MSAIARAANIAGAALGIEVRKPTTIGRAGPVAGVATRPRNPDQFTNAVVGIDGDKLSSYMTSAFRGRPRRLQDVYDGMRDRDDRVDAVCRTRTIAVQGRPFTLEPPEEAKGDPEAERVAANVRTIVNRIRSGGGLTHKGGGGWASCVGLLMDGALRAYSVNELEWGVTAEGWKAPVSIHWRHPRRFSFDDDMRILLDDSGTGYNGVPLDAFGPDKFVIHSPTSGRAAYPTRRGVMLPMLFPSLAKRMGYQWWVKATERWGTPLPYIKVDGEASDTLVSEAQEMVNNLKADWGGVFWGNVEIDKLDGAPSGESMHQALCEFSNMAIAVVGLGQNLTTEVQGGSYAAALAHNLVRFDLLTGDLVELDDTINAQIIEPIVRYNWPGAPVPVYRTELESRESLTHEDWATGNFEPNEYRGSKGYPPRLDEEADEVPEADRPESLEAEGENVQQTALNGAQVQALSTLAEKVSSGILPADAAVEIALVSFPIDRPTAEAIFAPIAEGGPPALPTPSDEEPPEGGAAPDPFAVDRSRKHSTRPTTSGRKPVTARALSNALAGSGRTS